MASVYWIVLRESRLTETSLVQPAHWRLCFRCWNIRESNVRTTTNTVMLFFKHHPVRLSSTVITKYIHDINYNVLWYKQIFLSKGSRADEEPRWHTRSAGLSYLLWAVECTLHVLPTILLTLNAHLRIIGTGKTYPTTTVSCSDTPFQCILHKQVQKYRLHVPLRVLTREVTRKQRDKCARTVTLVRSLLLPTTCRSSDHRFQFLPLCLQKRKTHVLKNTLI